VFFLKLFLSCSSNQKSDSKTFIHGKLRQIDRYLIRAIDRRNLKSVKILLKKGANVNAQTTRGYTALMMCTGNKNIKGVKMLLEAGDRINIKKNNGHTALDIAKARGYKENFFNNDTYYK